MHNPRNQKSFLHHRMKIFKICMNQGIKKHTVQKAQKVDDVDWKLAIKHLKPHQSEHPSIQCMAFAKRTVVACRRTFPSLSSPYLILTRQPLPSNHFLARINCLSVSMSKYCALRNSPAFHFFSFSFYSLFGLNSSNFHN